MPAGQSRRYHHVVVEAAHGDDRLISVVVPTYRRGEHLRAAVQSLMEQQLAPGHTLEVIIAVSDGSIDDDMRTARELARNPRVRMTVALGPGPAAARNAGLATSSGSLVAFLDDDCTAEAGWLLAGVKALGHADIVQGRTLPDGPVPRFSHTLSVYPPSWLWESCNLFVRKDIASRIGAFDETWNPTGQVHDHMGEDAEWGWRLVRGGATPGFAPEAVVRHAVVARSFRQYLKYQARLRYFPRLFRIAPETRRICYRGYFVSRHHAVLAAVILSLSAGVLARRSGARRLGLRLMLLAGIGYLLPLRKTIPAMGVAGALTDLVWRIPTEAVEVGSALCGSIRWRRLLI